MNWLKKKTDKRKEIDDLIAEEGATDFNIKMLQQERGKQWKWNCWSVFIYILKP